MSGTFRLGAVLAFFVLTFCAAGAEDDFDAPKDTGARDAKRAVLKEIQLGMSVHDARKRLESIGYNCEVERNFVFTDESEGADKARRVSGPEILECNTVVKTGDGWKLWWVGVVYNKQKKVTDVLTRVVDYSSGKRDRDVAPY